MSVVPQVMDRGSELGLQTYANLFIKQTRRECMQEFRGCEANSEFNIATKENQKNDIMYALEDTSCCMRFCCPSSRPFIITVSEGAQKGGPVLAIYHRFCACPVGCCKCCCRQRVVVKNSEGAKLGEIKEACWMCVPKFNINKANGEHEYKLKPPTCCGGHLINCCAAGFCNCKVPFDIEDAVSGETVGKIAKVWSGLSQELFSDADNVETDFPVQADSASKARIVGAVFLLNQVFFEKNSGGN